MSDRRLEEAIRHLHPAPGVKLWHGGASVLGALRGVAPEVAAWKPYPDRHSIWDLALHVAYWNYAVRRRLADEPTGTFPRSPSNWPVLPNERSATAWKEDRRLVKECHDRLVEVVRGFDPSRLDDVAGDEGGTTYADLITGIVLHDTYHAGQIQMLKRLHRSKRRTIPT
jgi:uncharacterized damage-inducible protein DinB